MDSEPVEKPESAASAPTVGSKRSASEAIPRSGASDKITVRTIVPEERKVIPSAFTKPDSSALEVGNKEFEFYLQEEGKLGHRFYRNQLSPIPVYINLDLQGIRKMIMCTLETEFTEKQTLQGVLPVAEINQRSRSWSDILTNSVMTVIYLKLQHLHRYYPTMLGRYLSQVRVTGDIELPTPYAHCVQQLGYVEVKDLEQELRILPTYPDQTPNFGRNLGAIWSHADHSRTVQAVKQLGVPFTKVDIKVRKGSTWWLYRQIPAGDSIRLICPLPETNFTQEGAVLHSLFIDGLASVTSNRIADLTPIGNSSFAIMMRNPPPGITLSSFRACSKEPPELWLP